MVEICNWHRYYRRSGNEKNVRAGDLAALDSQAIYEGLLSVKRVVVAPSMRQAIKLSTTM